MSQEPVYVVRGAERFPFSRGILARSLIEVGLELEDAYNVASSLQDDLASTQEITRQKLRQRVCEILRERFDPKLAVRYEDYREELAEVIVLRDGPPVPFSKGLLSQSIRSSGLPASESYEVSRAIGDELLKRPRHQVTRDELRALTYRKIVGLSGLDAAERYRTWRSIKTMKTPLVILIGGATGAGKSTLAVELAHRIGFTNVISTDVIRQIMRTMFSREIMPLVHCSSYEAWRVYRGPEQGGEDPVLAGFHEQALEVSVGIRGMIQRAATERTHLILNGVHLIPGLIRPEECPGVNLAHIVVTVGDEKTHRHRFEVRGGDADDRSADQYLENFTAIRKIGSYCIRQARQTGTPIIDDAPIEQQVFVALNYLTDFLRGLPDFQEVKV